jgi:hypothetical protein
MADTKSTSDPITYHSGKELDKIAAATSNPSATASMEATASPELSQGGGVDDLFDRLELGEEDFDDVIIEEVDVDIIENTRWLAVARVHCKKNCSHEAFFSTNESGLELCKGGKDPSGWNQSLCDSMFLPR